MSDTDFVRQFGAIYEHSPWVAERAEPHVGDAVDPVEIARVMADCVDNAAVELQLALIRAHPDLAGKAQVAGELTADSTSEQASAGLDHCTAGEYEEFQTLNDSYREKFEFPFIKAVRGSSRREILDAFKSRLRNEYDAEFESALVEIHKIARLRLEAMGI